MGRGSRASATETQSVVVAVHHKKIGRGLAGRDGRVFSESRGWWNVDNGLQCSHSHFGFLALSAISCVTFELLDLLLKPLPMQ